MCEWLSHGEWCDVKLLCGGRSFSAHRAVLASVSTFLRQILLSCPVDETPTFIVLPDFDLEALSSVLFYIYNGEVVLHNHKVGFFLDIIQAMQIYIDCQYLPKIRDLAEDGNYEFNSCNDASKLKTDIFTLACGHDKDQRFINIKRGTEAQGVLLQNAQRDTDFHDNVVRSQNESELRRSRLGNLKLPCGDRQRNSFLRDLFIETYPRNGNVNGLTESVLAISNEYYRPPASVLSANANGEHLANRHSLHGFCTKTTQQTLDLSTLIQSEHQLQYRKQYNRNIESSVKMNKTLPCIKHSIDSRDLTFIHSKSESVTELPNDRVPWLPHQLGDNNIFCQLSTSTSPLNFQESFFDVMKCHLFKKSQSSVAQNFPWKCEDVRKGSRCGANSSSKVIFNQVLDNPWSPRMPNCYKPLRRKCDNSVLEKFTMEKGVINDSNNNQTTVTTDVVNLAASTLFQDKERPEVNSRQSISIVQDCFKCLHCDQVFTTSESLSLHMRRHSTTARYTCGDCGKAFSQLRNFKYHMSIHRGTREFAATCSVCGKYFNDRGYLSSHMKIHRNRKEYKCSLCPKSFNQRVAYNMHVRIHTGVKPHVCSECGKAFSRKMLLKQHQRTHSGERPYACTHCDKRFADRSNMTLHLRLHTGVKPFSCTLCPKSFTKKHHLKSHLNFHTGSKPYSCPRCKLAFTQSSNMRTHYKKCNAPESVDISTDNAISMDSTGNDSQSHS